MGRVIRKGFFILVILLFFSGPSFPTEKGPVVWFFSAQPERYFSAFFEIHLKRIIPASQLKSVNLYSQHPAELAKKINSPMDSAQVIIIMDFSREYQDAFFQQFQKVTFQKKPYLIAWNCDWENPPSSFQSIPIIINWDLALKSLQPLLPDHSAPILLIHQQETYIQSFLQSFPSQLPNQVFASSDFPHQLSFQPSLYFVSNDRIMEEYCSFLHPLICLESSTMALAELATGNILATIDLKPSQLASQIPQLLQPTTSTPVLTLTPKLIVKSSLPEADAYEVLHRCFMCGSK